MNKHQASFSDEAINTLAQSRNDALLNTSITLHGSGSDISNGIVAENRAKRKLVSSAMALALVDIAKAKKNIEMEKAFWNTYHCLGNITTHEDKIHGKYCKNRFCTVCLSIRKANLINKYYPTLSQWEQPYFVTLTAKSCSARQLEKRISKMIEGFQIIKERLRKRKSSPDLIGVRSLECNFNPVKRTYNPHFHLIIKNKKMAEALVSEWLKLFTSKFALRIAQDIQPVRDLTTNLIEIIKYGSKIFTEPDIKTKTKGEIGEKKLYVKALYNILVAMKGHRIFERFGFNNTSRDFAKSTTKHVVNFEEWTYIPTLNDWVNLESGVLLTSYEPSESLKDLLENHLNASME